MDIERCSSMIKALPYMSDTIVDDTLYEKVLSYLTLVLSTHDVQFIQTLNSTCQIFQHIKQACLIIKDQDYRVTTLCIRLVGRVVYYGKSSMFDQLKEQYNELLDMITSGITSSEGALRCSCIETCRLFIHCKEGYDWLLSTNNQHISYALLDQSSYVVTEACKLFSTCIRLNQKDLLELMDPSNLMISILNLQSDQKQILSALDFCWAIVNIKEENALIYIRSKKLLASMVPLLCSSDRMIRAKVLDILSILFTWDNHPLKTLDINIEEIDNSIDDAYSKMLFISNTMIIEAIKFDDLMTAVSLLETSLILLERSQQKLSADTYSIFISLFNICLNEIDENSSYENVIKLLSTTRQKNNLLQLVTRSIHRLVKISPQIMNKNIEKYIDIYNVLDNEECYSDPRVLKSTLELLTTTLENIQDDENQQKLLTKAMHSLVKIMDDDYTALDFKSLSIILTSFDYLLSHDQLGTLVTEHNTCKTLVEALNNKFLDTEWDIRDSVINFVGHLFEEPLSKTKLSFAINFNLPLEVFGRIHDSEPYVRASALEVLAKMMKCKEGWEYIQRHTASRELSSKLPSLLYDTEAFVRRAVIDAIVCLVDNRSCQGMTMEIKDSKNQNSLSPEILQSLIDDGDFDVRIRACQLIEHLWILYNHEKLQQKKKPSSEFIFFHHIHAGKLLVEAANDTNRVVRIEAYRIIMDILTEYRPEQVNTASKRQLHDEDDFTTSFLDLISSVDLERLKYSLDPEHLYQEAFDINADMMTQSIVPTNPDDDINMLDCY